LAAFRGAMELHEVISITRSRFGGFNSPASAEDLSELRTLLGSLPEVVRSLYEDHNGSDRLPEANGVRLAARLMPIAEVVKTHNAMLPLANSLPKVGRVAWFWTDDNSNYCGVYTDGLLCGWLCVLDHEEPMLTPAFRSIASFMSRLLADALNEGGENAACDLPYLVREIPVTGPDSATVRSDRELASLFRRQYSDDTDVDLRRLRAFCSICLTPFEDTKEVLAFLNDVDMWTSEAAIRLLEVRRWRGEVDQIERLAREGRPNGDGAAMRLLARMNTNHSRQAVTRLKQTLQGQKLKRLEMWADRKLPLQPPRW
jgi:hypothetical protein